MNKPFLFLLIFLFSLCADCFASGVFRSDPISDDMRSQMIKSGVWKSDCPVQLNDLSILTFSYYDFTGDDHDDGQILVNKSIAEPALQVLEALYEKQFPINSPSTLISFSGNWREAENQNQSYGFICYRDASQQFSQDSYGTSITMNPVENPEIDFISNSRYANLCNLLNRFINCEKLFPSARVYVLPAQGILSVNRSLQLKGMVDPIASIFKTNGFSWQGDGTNYISWKKFIYSQQVNHAKAKNN